MNPNSYISGYRLNYSTDTDNSSNSKSNNSIFTAIQQVDSKRSANPDRKFVEENAQDNTGYFKRLKFSTSSLLKRINTSKRSEEKSNNSTTANLQTSEISSFERGNSQLSISKPFDKLGISFRRKKKEVYFRENNKGTVNNRCEKDFVFLNEMSVSEKCRVSIECKNNIISIEGHKKN